MISCYRISIYDNISDVDIPSIDTTTSMRQQAYMTRDRAYMLNPQVN